MKETDFKRNRNDNNIDPKYTGLISIPMHYVYKQESYCLNMGHADGDFRHSNEQKATLTESPY